MLFPALFVCAADQINVFAAASLKDAFTTIAQKYEAAHPVKINLNFAGSQTLAAQISHGAPADVFAAASMKSLQNAPIDSDSIRLFAFNKLTVIFSKPGRSLKDLAKSNRIVVADVSVPAGKYAEEFLGKASKSYGEAWTKSVYQHVVSRELDVRSVLAKVRLGEADAGIVYVSDALSAPGKVFQAPIPDGLNVLAQYPVALTGRQENRDLAKAFLKSMFEPGPQAIFVQNGFISPLAPVSTWKLTIGGKSQVVSLKSWNRLPKQTIKVTGHDGKIGTVSGAPIGSLLRPPFRTAIFTGADGYTKTLSAADLAKGNAVFVREPDGNIQIVVKGLKPSFWVRWIRSIKLSN